MAPWTQKLGQTLGKLTLDRSSADASTLTTQECFLYSYRNTGVYRPYTELARCYKAGCPLCGLLVKKLLKRIVEKQSRIRVFVDEELACPCIRLELLYGPRFEIYQVLKDGPAYDASSGFNIHTALEYPRDTRRLLGSLDWVATRPEVASHAGSQECFSRARAWLLHCLKNHALCRSSDLDQNKLPKRLIDISNTEHIRLCDTSAILSGSIDYVALSHCWGSEQDYVTNRDTLELRVERIRLEDMPRTFQDAIITTRELGILYLWIDSLCIIQDDIDDWAIESSNMCHIYANATCTIAASAAENDAQGFLIERPERQQFFEASVQQRTFRLRSDLHKTGEGVTRLYTRGWIFQERLLSRRILYFDQHEMRWECGTKQTCECESELPLPDHDLSSPSKAQKYLRQSLALQDVDSSRQILEWWRKVVVEDYSRLNLTRLTDALPALSGVAALIHASTKDTYLAGLWLSCFTESLLWRPRDISSPVRFPGNEVHAIAERNPQAPTWSWASITTSVVHEIIHKSYVELLDHDITLETVDQTGGVRQGIILISCPIFPKHNRTTTSPAWREWIDLGEGELKLQGSATYDVYLKDELPPYRMALIGARKHRLDSQHNSVTFCGILLAQSDLAGHAQRIGHWQAKFHESAQAPFDANVLEQHRERVLVT